MDSWEHKDIQFYQRPAVGYQMFLLRPVQGCKLYDTLHTVIECRYGSPYSTPAPNEAEARKQADQYAMVAIATRWYREGTRTDVHIYPFGGLIGDMRLVPRKPRRV